MSNFKQQRAQNLLKELIPEALASLGEDEFCGFSVLDVELSRGKYDAKVYIDGSFIDEAQDKQTMVLLNSASGYVGEVVKRELGWFRAPKFRFYVDREVERINKMEDLFKKAFLQIKQKK